SRTATIPAPRHRCMLPPPRPPAVRPRRCIASKHSLLWCLQRKGHATVRLDMRAHSERLVQSRARRQVVVYRLRAVELALPERDLRVRQLERTAHPLAVLPARDPVAAPPLLKRQLLRGTTITGLLHLREQRLHFVLHLIAQQALPDSRLLQGRLLLLQPGRPLESAEQRQAHLDADLPAVRAELVAPPEEPGVAVVLCVDRVAAEQRDRRQVLGALDAHLRTTKPLVQTRLAHIRAVRERGLDRLLHVVDVHALERGELHRA